MTLPFKKYSPEIILAFCWILVQAGLLWHFEIIGILEAKKYIVASQVFLDNGTVRPRLTFYTTFILFLSLLFKIGIGLTGAVIIQMILSGLSTIFFYRSLKIRFDRTAALVAVFFLVISCEAQFYNVLLYSESFFLSLLLIFLSLLLRMDAGQKIHIGWVVSLSVILLFSRPIFLFILIAVLIYFFYKKWGLRIYAFLLPTLVICILMIFWTNPDLINLFVEFKNGKIICGTEIQALERPQQASFFGMIWFFNKAAILKSFYLFSMLRPYYSTMLNFSIALFYPAYLLAIVGTFRKDDQRLKRLCFTAIILISISVIFICVSWHGRFAVPMILFILILAAKGTRSLKGHFNIGLKGV